MEESVRAQITKLRCSGSTPTKYSDVSSSEKNKQTVSQVTDLKSQSEAKIDNEAVKKLLEIAPNDVGQSSDESYTMEDLDNFIKSVKR